MKTNTPAVLAAALVVLALGPGCFQVEHVLTLRADGGGSLHLRFETPAGPAEGSEGDGDRPEPAVGWPDFSAEDVRAEFKPYEPLGVLLKEVTLSERDGRRILQIMVEFTSLAELAQTELLPEHGVSLRREAGDRYAFEWHAGGPGAEAFRHVDLSDPDTDAQVKALLQGLRAEIRFVAPRPIVETNADRRGEREAAWVFDLEKDPKTLARIQRTTMRAVFDGAGLDLPEFVRQRVRLPVPP